MTKIKFCGLTRPCDIDAANAVGPDYVGFVFARNSKRYVSPAQAAELKKRLDGRIKAVGVFVGEAPETVAGLLTDGTIDVAQLHGGEDEDYIRHLRTLTDKPIIKAFCINTAADLMAVRLSSADCVLLDAGSGSGKTFDWRTLRSVKRPYFLAGGLSPDNVGDAAAQLQPYAVDVSSGIETNGVKDKTKMAAFVAAVRKEEQI